MRTKNVDMPWANGWTEKWGKKCDIERRRDRKKERRRKIKSTRCCVSLPGEPQRNSLCNKSVFIGIVKLLWLWATAIYWPPHQYNERESFNCLENMNFWAKWTKNVEKPNDMKVLFCQLKTGECGCGAGSASNREITYNKCEIIIAQPSANQ